MAWLTLPRLIVAGFLMVAMPLMVGIVTALVQVDRLARDGQVALETVRRQVGVSRTLAARVTELERAARQFHVSSDAAYRSLYEQHRHNVLAMLAQLGTDDLQAELQPTLERVRGAEAGSHAAFEQPASGSTDALENAFAELHAATLDVVRHYNSVARDLGDAMPDRAGELRRLLLAQAVLVVPLSALLAAVFGLLIATPVRQVERAIGALGRGAFSEPVTITGTADLQQLGQRLDWLRRRLLALEAQKARFLRNVSHELKTPLTNIREAAELLHDGGERGSEQATVTRILRDNSIRLQRMIEELLRYGADSDLTPDELTESVRLDELVADVARDAAPTLTIRNVTLSCQLAPVVVRGNGKQLRLIIDNLVSNATKYTPAGGTIGVVLAEAADGAVTLDVVDSGPGVPEDDAAHLFEWFYTGRPPPELAVAGTGMGLAIAQEYAHQHGGTITLEPSTQGAHFRLNIGTIHHAAG